MTEFDLVRVEFEMKLRETFEKVKDPDVHIVHTKQLVGQLTESLISLIDNRIEKLARENGQ